jgi:uncharacterized protein
MKNRHLIVLLIVVGLLGFFTGYLFSFPTSEIVRTVEICSFPTSFPPSSPQNTSTIVNFPNNKKTKTLKASSNIVAVTSEGYGILGKVNVEIRNGKGRVLMNTNPFTEPDIQYSVEKASEVASLITKKDLSDKDVIISFDVNGKLIGGESAGAAITTAIIAALEKKKVNEEVAVTGTIEKDGSIGRVAGIPEKMIAASKNRVKIFLLPKGQRYFTIYERTSQTREIFPGFYYRKYYYKPKRIDLKEYAKEELDLTIIEISNIQDVVKYSLG